MSTTIFVIGALLCWVGSIEARAFGQRVEYRYEYDPKRDSQPRVHVKFDDVTDESELMRIFNQRKSSEVRKSPSRYEETPAPFQYSPPSLFFDEDNDRHFQVPYNPMDRGNRDAGWRNVPFAENQEWHREFVNLPVHKFVRPESQDNLAEQMAAFLRRQSESILSRHFPKMSRRHFSDPPEFITPPKFSKFTYLS